MRKQSKSIPVNTMTDNFDAGIAIEKVSFKSLPTLDNATSKELEIANQSHREDRHSFFLLEEGTVHLEIDFQKYEINQSSFIYLHPDQVHRIIALENVTVSSWAMDNESLNPEYLEVLEAITPVKPLVLNEETFFLISEAVSMAVQFSKRKSDKLYHSLLKDSCNALVALVLSQYLAQTKPTDKFSRFEIVTKDFRGLLEGNYTTLKRPAQYAQKLHLSTPYLNECVKKTTGYSVSHHIHQRIILEAKRLLYHSDKSVKEIAIELGYDDYPYFSRLFTNVTGMTALTFRNKNFD
ncbi:AraC-like DNA-binding protein/mannose-6-phosphate isomerase-like protein (cupin superfamily) [Pedobacter cryoconitis]|uniref:AraC-like DNA-binding protein/mannose-6-phosphate isomerase-like protein (Cupin superfamily) n=1 Tax=Pedobacter cryoconitis TaxID=188932 RepID=A0A7W8YSU4_9SPHI|nr:helix-turn-helix transcriptional regulator [Pedobacter cryoconitis]MBB5621183.1 AraC-like DNA-binding protein/mannose-6-phosphate isomerase-like protein (cupin superfamily) [Pedobacter cryoconitis]